MESPSPSLEHCNPPEEDPTTSGTDSTTTNPMVCSSEDSISKEGTVLHLNSIWDSVYIERLGARGMEDEFWKCCHCGSTFKYWNCSKAMYHAAKLSGHHIKPCIAKIPNHVLSSYRALVARSSRKKNTSMASKKQHSDNISERHKTNRESLQALGRRAPKRKNIDTLNLRMNRTKMKPNHLVLFPVHQRPPHMLSAPYHQTPLVHTGAMSLLDGLIMQSRTLNQVHTQAIFFPHLLPAIMPPKWLM